LCLYMHMGTNTTHTIHSSDMHLKKRVLNKLKP